MSSDSPEFENAKKAYSEAAASQKEKREAVEKAQAALEAVKSDCEQAEEATRQAYNSLTQILKEEAGDA